MALHETAHARGVIPVPVAVGCEVVVHRSEFSLSAALAAGDVIHASFLPAGHVPVDIIVDADDLGAGDVSVGILDADLADIDTTASGGAPWLDAAAPANAGLRADDAGLYALARVESDPNADRPVGIKLDAAATATSGVIGLTLLYRSA